MSTGACVVDSVTENPVSKKPRLEIRENEIPTESINENLSNLSGFTIESVLSNSTDRKSICLKGTFDSKEGEAIVLLEKTAFVEEDIKGSSREYFTEQYPLQKVFSNDIYGNYKYYPNKVLSEIKTTIIHPATEKHIVKYSSQKRYIVDETPRIYKEVVLPHLTNEQFNLQWVYNILEHKSETERIVFEDADPTDGFVMLPDLKWNGEVETLYLLAIVNKRGIKSLRDLTEEHLPLLRNIKQKGIETIKEKYSLDASRLRIFLHYQPSFYHLHVHFCYLQHDAPGILVEKAHLLSSVISNIELLPDYYQKATIPFAIRENEKLFKKLESEGTLKSC